MIETPEELDLGRDEARMRGGRDAERQRATLQTLLDRMYSGKPGVPHWPVQILADEVGMGKTFVALGLAYTVLKQLGQLPGFADCAPKVLVIAPQNSALVDKWSREVGEFATRCFDRFHAEQAEKLCKVLKADRVDKLVAALRTPESQVVITHMGVLSGGKKLLHYDLKRRILLAALFRYWGKRRFPLESRALLLKGAPESWPRKIEELESAFEEGDVGLPFAQLGQCVDWLTRFAGRDEGQRDLEELFALCAYLARPYKRDRADGFGQVEKLLTRLYREVCFAGLDSPLPLVIVDEAHNWRNASNGYGTFSNWLAPLTRRLLMLTATPFQLRPEEMLSLVRAGEAIRPFPDAAECQAYSARIEQFREITIRPVLERAATRSRSFAKAWTKLPNGCQTELESTWNSTWMTETRAQLSQLANLDGVVHEQSVHLIISKAVLRVPTDLREILGEGLWLFTLNQDLSQELSALVIRHRRRTEHRCVKVGAEFHSDTRAIAQRSDRHCLHAAPGIDVRGSGELPHYLLMRAVSEMKQGAGRTSLGSALTGCYSTLRAGDEARRMKDAFGPDSLGAKYLQLLDELVDESRDPEHPKVRALTDQVLNAWRRGEKFLIFCFRIHTAKRLKAILEDLVQEELQGRLTAIGLTDEQLKSLRARLVRRDDSLISLVQDRVLWSLLWAARSCSLALPEISAESLRLVDNDLLELARLALRAGVDLRSPTPDLVFIHRATEHILARRLLRDVAEKSPLFRRFCARIADESWVKWTYGIAPSEGPSEPGERDQSERDQSERDQGERDQGERDQGERDQGERDQGERDQGERDQGERDQGERDQGEDDGRGIERAYALRDEAREADVALLARDLGNRRTILNRYAEAPCFWLGSNPEQWLARDDRSAATLQSFHAQLLGAMRHNTQLLWEERRAALLALRRTVLARSLLIRILPGNLERENQGWAESTVEGLFQIREFQHETLAERLTVFLEDFRAAAGPSSDPKQTRHALLDVTTGRSGAVALVDGSTDAATRARVFMGFNSPLLPDVLVCTSVGAEGIDLHRHCRHVVHYDLAWNPAVLEQRTGRVDRIGSKAHRDRMRWVDSELPPFLEVGVPFLAGTYDERMFEELRTRAQIFEVLTGGDVAADSLEGRDDGAHPEGVEQGFSVPVLPAAMVEDLRVKLHVWE